MPRWPVMNLPIASAAERTVGDTMVAGSQIRLCSLTLEKRFAVALGMMTTLVSHGTSHQIEQRHKIALVEHCVGARQNTKGFL